MFNLNFVKEKLKTAQEKYERSKQKLETLLTSFRSRVRTFKDFISRKKVNQVQELHPVENKELQDLVSKKQEIETVKREVEADRELVQFYLEIFTELSAREVGEEPTEEFPTDDSLGIPIDDPDYY